MEDGSHIGVVVAAVFGAVDVVIAQFVGFEPGGGVLAGGDVLFDVQVGMKKQCITSADWRVRRMGRPAGT